MTMVQTAARRTLVRLARRVAAQEHRLRKSPLARKVAALEYGLRNAAVRFKFGTIPDVRGYVPLFSPWLMDGAFRQLLARAAPYTLVSADRCYVLYTLASQALHLHGDIWECGVYKGGTALLLAQAIAQGAGTPARPQLHLFDTFTGLPPTDTQRDLLHAGAFADTTLDAVTRLLEEYDFVSYHRGTMPGTFEELEAATISFAHVDVDIYDSVLACCAFIYPRLVAGAVMVFDDYGFPSCPGARRAVDEFFADKPERPLVLHSGQAVVFALGAARSGAAVPVR